MMNHFGDGFMGGNTGIVPVTTLPADASTYGPRVLYYKYPVVSSLPATVVNDARYVLDATKVEYLGRSVAHLADTDGVYLPIPCSDFTCDFKIACMFNDTNTDAGEFVFWVLQGDGFQKRIHFRTNSDNTITAEVDGLGVDPVYIKTANSYTVGVFNSFSFEKRGLSLTMSLNGVETSSVLSAQPTSNDFTINNIVDVGSNSPLQIYCIQQSLNGVLIDSIPCDESTGTTLRNTVSPDRPATLSDATAHALAWVAQSAPTLTVWGWGKKTCSFISQTSIPNYYCDSVDGSDLNDGLTEETAKKTVEGIKTLAISSCVLNFKRGSYFREELSGIPENCVVKAYGSGDRPIFDCTDIATGFSKTDGRTNIYQFQTLNGFSGSGIRISVFENNVKLLRVSSLDLCDSTVGSMYCVVSYSGEDTVYVHPYDSSNPISDGKIYEVTTRERGIWMSEGSECYSMHTQRNAHNDGSFIGSKYSEDCVALDGTVHNFWNGGIAKDCVAERIESGTLFVSYKTLTDDLTSFRYINCRASGSAVRDGGYATSESVGFLVHAGTSGGLYEVGSVLFENCTAENITDSAFSVEDTAIVLYNACVTKNSNRMYFTEARRNYLYGCKASWKNGTAETITFNRFLYQDSPTELVKVHGCGIASKRSDATVNARASMIEFIGNSVSFDGSSWFAYFQADNECESFICKENIINNCTGALYDINSLDTVLVAENNIVENNTIDIKVSGNSYSSFTSYQNGENNDIGSLVADPLFSGNVEDLDFSIDENSPANLINSGSTNYKKTSEDVDIANVWNQIS